MLLIPFLTKWKLTRPPRQDSYDANTTAPGLNWQIKESKAFWNTLMSIKVKVFKVFIMFATELSTATNYRVLKEETSICVIKMLLKMVKVVVIFLFIH